MFKDTKEFNKAWNYFEEKYSRHYKLCPKLPESIMQYMPQYRSSQTFQWVCETFKLWKDFKKNEWDNIKDSVDKSYETKHIRDCLINREFKKETRKTLKLF